jgi:hypothetical protein
LPNTSTFVVTLPRRHDNHSPSLDWPLLPFPELLTVPGAKHEEPSELVSWSGINILTQFPEVISSGKSKTTRWGGVTSSKLPDCKPGCTEHTDTLHNAIELLKHSHTVSGQMFQSWKWESKNPLEDISWLEAADAIGDIYTLSSPVGQLDNLPVAPTTLNAQLLQICKWGKIHVRWILLMFPYLPHSCQAIVPLQSFPRRRS